MKYHKANLHSYAGRYLTNYFKSSHPAYHLPSLLFPPIALAGKMFANIRFDGTALLTDDTQLLFLPESNTQLPDTGTLWQLFIQHLIAFDNQKKAPYLWQCALNRRLTSRFQLEEDIYARATNRSGLLTALKHATLIRPEIIEQVINSDDDRHLQQLKIDAYTDFYLTLIATFDQAVVEEIILHCAEHNIDLPAEWTILADSGFVGQILPSWQGNRLYTPDQHLLTLLQQRHQSDNGYFYRACLLAEKINYAGVHSYVLNNISDAGRNSCYDWQHWLVKNGNCAQEAIPGFFLDLFYLSRAMHKFIRYQMELLKQAGLTNIHEEIIALYNRYPDYFNNAELHS